MKKRMAFLSLLIVFLFAAPAIMAAEEPKEEPAAAEQAAQAEPEAEAAAEPEAESHVIFAGMQVGLDEHGNLRQLTAEEAAELSKAMHMTYGLQVKTGQRLQLKNGSNVVAIGQEYWRSTVVTIDEDGEAHINCVTGTDATRAAADHKHSDDEQ